jgi:hypothetical protein
MSSDLQTNWPWIVQRFKKGILSTRFYSFATVNTDGSAHVAPYASLVLNSDCTGYYSEVYPNQMSRNLARDPRVCIMAVDIGMVYWLKSLFKGRFNQWPGVRLYGTVDRSRKARPGEIERWLKRVKKYKWSRGYDLIWKEINTVRDISFDRFEPVHCGRMTSRLADGKAAAV